MRKSIVLFASLVIFSPAVFAAGHKHAAPAASSLAKPMESTTQGTVTVEGHSISYDAKAGTIILKNKAGKPTVSMFYVAYLKRGVKNPADRPITFFYNGGPGSSSMWLHMGAFGPERVGTADHTHTPPAPYKLVNNDYSLLDATDEVFIDAPSTGFSRLITKDKGGSGKAKQFYSVDGDAHAFAQFITRFLIRNNRWNSPKYLFGESYGTTRSAVLSRYLETQDDMDLNGVVLLSAILSYDLGNDDDPQHNSGMPLTYELALPTYTATAWYHHKLPNQPKELQPLLKKVEHFAMHDYADALNAGNALPQAQKQQIAEQLHQYTGLPAAYWLKANLRVNGGEFEKTLLSDSDESTGRLDTRFTGPTMDPLSQGSHYDPQAAAISSAYVSLFNGYVRNTLDFKPNLLYRPEYYSSVLAHWDYLHSPPGTHRELDQATNVMPDLATAMKYNPDLKVMLNAGYFDLATPFYSAVYEMEHLPIPSSLTRNISYHYYKSGHMVYVHVPALKKLHDNVAAFIQSTDNVH
ncbi:MAG: S10 family peptidase [Gammaproteobacteria bacterium]